MLSEIKTIQCHNTACFKGAKALEINTDSNCQDGTPVMPPLVMGEHTRVTISVNDVYHSNNKSIPTIFLHYIVLGGMVNSVIYLRCIKPLLPSPG